MCLSGSGCLILCRRGWFSVTVLCNCMCFCQCVRVRVSHNACEYECVCESAGV